MLSIGIVGLPNVGKSTLFNTLTKGGAQAANYPFCTIEPNVGIVEVPDERMSKLAELEKSENEIPAAIKFVDIAGLVAGASKGEGLGNKFLAHIREVDAIAQVVRFFSDPNVVHTAGAINPLEDIKTIETELILADLETVEGRYQKVAKDPDKESVKLKNILEKVRKHLDDGQPAREVELTNEEKMTVKDLQLLTFKPIIYVANVDSLGSMEDGLKSEHAWVEVAANEGANLDEFVRKSFEVLGLISFFTAGPKEARAWPVESGSKAPQAAGKIHTDFERGFIKAEVVAYDDFVNNNGWVGSKTTGKMRLEGKEYIVRDGDVMLFKFNV